MDRAVKKRALAGAKTAPDSNDRGAGSLSRAQGRKKAPEIIVPCEPIELFIPGDPVSWARPVPIVGRSSITPEKQRRHKQMLQLYFRRAYGNRPAIPMGVAVGVKIDFIYQGPEKQMGRMKPTRPDIDNLSKQVLDAMQGSHAPLIITDDGQVTSLVLTKTYGLEAGTRVTIWQIEQ